MDIEIKEKHPRIKKYIWWIGAGVLLTGVTVWAALSAGTSTYAAQADDMMTGEVILGEFKDYIRINGKVETGVTVQISALENGIVESKAVEEGTMVEAGDVILTLRNPNLRQQILDSESQLAERQNMLRDTELAMEKERLQVKQDLLTARTDMSRKRRIADQQKALYDENLTSREEYLQAREDYELACENVQLLQSRLRQDSIYRSVQVGMMMESLHNMEENFALVRQRAENLNIRASHSGQLGSLNAELGQNITPGQQIGQINILDNYKVTVMIDEHYIDRVSTGLKATARRQNQQLDMTLSKVYPEVTDGKFRADLVIDGEMPDNLRVGQTYPVELLLGESSESVMIPRGPFFQSTGGHWVYVLAPDGRSATRRNITIGRQNPRYYEVTEGLDAGERIIISSYSGYGGADKIIISN